ncbi:MAG TPA: adenylate/guanylate cyclase domain-containing protein [Anaerolineales bacterium]|nr:adenylate/guanylate cyclase domain-containing protein [Anaerolineales bacterium]
MNRAPSTPRFRVLLIALTAIVLMALELGSNLPNVSTPLGSLELGARDTLMRLRGDRTPSGNIVIVAIDDASFQWTKYEWPWPRAYLAQIVQAVNKGGARVVGLDVFLSEAGKDAGGDAALAQALSQSPSSISDMEVLRPGPGTVSLSLPVEPIRTALKGMGITTIVQDKDAVTRSIQAYDSYNGQVYYNWAFQVASQYLGVPPPSDAAPGGLTFNGQRIPLFNGLLRVNYNGPAGTYPTYSAYQVVLGDVLQEDPNAFKGKIVLIGATTLTLHDVYATPFSAQQPTPGVEVVANAVDTILNGDYLRETPPWAALLIIIVMGVLAGLISRMQRPSLSLIIMAIGMVVYAAATYLIFIGRGLYIPTVAPQLMLFLGVVLPALEQSVSQELEKRRVRNLFSRFISPQMVDQLLKTQDINSLNKRANLSILFSDIRGFTTLSEKLLPEEVVSVLNPYLEAMTKVIEKNGGTVDKYEGDAIVAFFGEPVVHEDHARRAVRTAVEMRQALAELHGLWEKQGRTFRIEIGIGINSGEVFVGLLGSAQRINYTVIGDNANLASRLQDLTKTYQWPVLISESTYDQVKDEFEAQLADSVIVKGRSEAVKVYKLIGRRDTPDSGHIQPWDAQTITMTRPKQL